MECAADQVLLQVITPYTRIRIPFISRELNISDGEVESPGGGEGDEAVEGETAAKRIRSALRDMPPKRREAALLRLDAGLSYREIAEAMDTSEGSARVLVHTAIKQLKTELSDLLDQG